MKSTLNPNASAWVPKASSRPQLPPGEIPFVVVLIGPPGVGKSSQGAALHTLLNFEFLSVDDKLQEMRDVDPAVDANWSAKYYTSMANNLLEDYVRMVKDERIPGLVIEYVKTPDSAVIVEETCRRHGLRVNCTLLFNLDDILVLTSRMRGKVGGRRADLNPQALLSKIHEFMFVEKAFHSHYHTAPGFRVLDATQPCARVTAEILEIIQQLKGPTAATPPSEPTPDPPIAPAMNFVPAAAPFLQFVNDKAEVMTLLAAIQHFIGLNVNRDRRFPGSTAMMLDESGLKNLCATDHRYVVSKKVTGLRHLLVHLKGDSSRPPATYLVDRAFAAFRCDVLPAAAADWGDMLLDGCLVMAGEANSKALFVVFDCLYYDGTRAIPENLDSRLEYVLKRFPLETAIPQQLAALPPNTCAVVCKQYSHIRDLPRLLREVEAPDPQALYPVDGLIFTPKKNGYRTNFDPHLFKWKPVDRCTVDFRLTENRQGGHDLLLARPVGKELREMPYDSLESGVTLPAALVGSVVECRPIQKADSTGIVRTMWQIQSIRSDKNAPDREDAATACLQNNLNAPRLLALYHQFSQPQPEMYGPPGTMTAGLPVDPSGRYSPPVGMPIYVGQLPPGLMGMAPNQYGGSSPTMMSRPDYMSMATASGLSQMYGPMSMGPISPMIGSGGQMMQHYPMPPPSQLQPTNRPYPPSRDMGGRAPGILSNGPAGRPILSVGPLPTSAPMVYVGPPMASAPPAVIRVGSGEGWALAADPSRDEYGGVRYGRTSPPLGSAPIMDPAVVTVGAAATFEPHSGQATPSRPERRESGSGSAQPATPPSQQYTTSALAHLSLTTEPKEHRRLADWPFFQTPQNSRVPFSALDLDSYEDRNHAILRTRVYDPSEKENTPVRGSNAYHDAPDKSHSASKALSSPGRMGFNPAMASRQPTAQDFAAAVKEWVLRKFVPRPSAAKPRPFNAVDVSIGRGGDIPKWEKARCAHLLSLGSNPACLEECRGRVAGQDLEMGTEFLCADIQAEAFALPDSVRVPTGQYDVVGMFFCLEQAFQSEPKARRAIANAAHLLKPGGRLIILTNDAEALAERVERLGRRFETPAFRFALLSDTEHLHQGAFGVEYALEDDDASPLRTFAVPKDALRGLCRQEGLEPLPQDHGMFNFADVASYIEKSVSKGHLWRDLPTEDRELVSLWATAVFEKAA